MNRNSSIALFGAVFAVSIGLMGVNGVFSMPTGITTGTDYQEQSGNILGHVTLVAQDSSGNIKAYRQMDNVVTNVGRTCTAQAVFGGLSSSNCQTRGAFQYIGIGSATATELTADTGLGASIAGYPPQVRTTYSLSNSTGATGGIAVMSTTYGFTNTQTVAEADLQDSASTGASLQHTFAHKAISPTIGVASGDTLTVTWTITTG